MNNIRSIKNLNINDKAKTKEQYEIIINVSMQEIKRLELCIILQEETIKINKYSDVELNIKKFIEYLKNGAFIMNEYNEYKRYQKFEEELEDIYYVDDMESEGNNYCRDTELIKQEIKKTKRKIHQEKFMMCIHKLKLSLPDHLIYEIGTFM